MLTSTFISRCIFIPCNEVQCSGWLVKKCYLNPLPRTGWRPTGERVQFSWWLVKTFWRNPPPEQGEESPVCEKTWRRAIISPPPEQGEESLKRPLFCCSGEEAWIKLLPRATSEGAAMLRDHTSMRTLVKLVKNIIVLGTGKEHVFFHVCLLCTCSSHLKYTHPHASRGPLSLRPPRGVIWELQH